MTRSFLEFFDDLGIRLWGERESEIKMERKTPTSQGN